MTSEEIAIKFLKDKQKKLVKNFQTDIFSLEQTGEYEKYKTDDNYFKALNLSNGIDELLKDLEVLAIIKQKPLESGICMNYININIQYPKMLDYEHYCMTIKGDKRVDKNEFEILKVIFHK